MVLAVSLSIACKILYMMISFGGQAYTVRIIACKILYIVTSYTAVSGYYPSQLSNIIMDIDGQVQLA
jgi:hypothetical protein